MSQPPQNNTEETHRVRQWFPVLAHTHIHTPVRVVQYHARKGDRQRQGESGTAGEWRESKLDGPQDQLYIVSSNVDTQTHSCGTEK